jgi:hypothetical protein
MADALRLLLDELIDAAEEQLEAARAVDLPALDAATRRREQLLVEVDALRGSLSRAQVGPDARARLRQLRALDDRLTRLLTAAGRAFEKALPRPVDPTYTPHGRMRA